MAQMFLNLEKAADTLDLTPAEVNRLREKGKLYGYRDGADWKFKPEEIERYMQELKSRRTEDDSSGEGDVLLSEVEFGQSDPDASGTVIGPPNSASADSDVRLAGSDLDLGGSDLQLSGSDVSSDDDGIDSKVSGFEDLDLTLDQDLTLDDSKISLVDDGSDATSSSSLDLTSEGERLDDDDFVLGGSGSSGSGITIGGDSGISLIDPADSGLSLEEPLELAGGAEESLELGEDDMLSFSEDTDNESPTELKSDGDFLLTPLDDDEGGDDSESGSQVIALDDEVSGDENAATMISGSPGMPNMLGDDDLGMGMDEGIGEFGADASLGVAPGLATDESVMGMGALPETPYSKLSIAGLVGCILVLSLTGMMMVDLIRNMWSWDTPYSFNSSLMDSILGLFG